TAVPLLLFTGARLARRALSRREPPDNEDGRKKRGNEEPLLENLHGCKYSSPACVMQTVDLGNGSRLMSYTMAQRIGRYEILDTIGTKATGHVYLARDPSAGRDVALETIELAGPRGEEA